MGVRDLVQFMLEVYQIIVDGVSKLSDNEIMVQFIMFLLVGFEIIGSILINVVYFFVVNLKVQNKFIEEIDKVEEICGSIFFYDYV